MARTPNSISSSLVDWMHDLIALGPKAHAKWLDERRRWFAKDLPDWDERMPVRMVHDPVFLEDGYIITQMVTDYHFEQVRPSNPTLDVSGEQRLLTVLRGLRRMGVPGGFVDDESRSLPWLPKWRRSSGEDQTGESSGRGEGSG